MPNPEQQDRAEIDRSVPTSVQICANAYTLGDRWRDARSDLSNYIELLYEPKRRLSTAAVLSSVAVERGHSLRPAVV